MTDPKQTPEQTRSIETSIEVDAPPEALWAALADAEELTRWFPPEARVEPGEGGKIWMSWGEGDVAGESTITIWEPSRRLRTEMEVPGSPEPIAMDYVIDAKKGGGVTLRLVNSGFSPDASWDDQYDATVRGWRLALGELKHYLEHHRGRPRAFLSLHRDLDDEAHARRAWDALVENAGLAEKGTFEGLRPGEPYETVASWDERLHGQVVVLGPPRDLAITVADWDEAYLSVMVVKATLAPWDRRVYVRVGFWGEGRKHVDRVRTNVEDALEAIAS